MFNVTQTQAAAAVNLHAGNRHLDNYEKALMQWKTDALKSLTPQLGDENWKKGGEIVNVYDEVLKAYQNNVAFLDLKDRSLDTLPPLWGLRHLEVLDASGNQLTDLPDLPKSLSSVSLAFNDFAEVPEKILEFQPDQPCTIHFRFNRELSYVVIQRAKATLEAYRAVGHTNLTVELDDMGWGWSKYSSRRSD